MSDEIVRLAREAASEARDAFAQDWLDAEATGERPDLMRIEAEIPVEWIVHMADRIEELEAENHLLKTCGIAEIAARNPSVMEYMQHWEGRAEAAEAKLAKAVAALDKLARLGNGEKPGNSDGNMIARAAIAEINGGGDE